MANLMTSENPILRLRGFEIHKMKCSSEVQQAILLDLRGIVQKAPMFTPEMAGGQKMSVRMTSAGDVGWYSDVAGYRYMAAHPSGKAWPNIPNRLLDLWAAVSGCDRAPDSCLINFYGEGARMGMHQDLDEADKSFPVVSLSLGDEGLFRMGGVTKGGKTDAIWLTSGDVVVMGGDARLAWHGVDKTRFGSLRLLPKAGRINVTLRVAQ